MRRGVVNGNGGGSNLSPLPLRNEKLHFDRSDLSVSDDPFDCRPLDLEDLAGVLGALLLVPPLRVAPNPYRANELRGDLVPFFKSPVDLLVRNAEKIRGGVLVDIGGGVGASSASSSPYALSSATDDRLVNGKSD